MSSSAQAGRRGPRSQLAARRVGLTAPAAAAHPRQRFWRHRVRLLRHRNKPCHKQRRQRTPDFGNKGSSRALKTPSLFIAASPPPVRTHGGQPGRETLRAAPPSAAPGRAPSPPPPPEEVAGGGPAAPRVLIGGPEAAAGRLRARRRTARRGSGQGHAAEVPPVPSSPVRSGPHPAPTAKAWWRVNAAGARAALSLLSPCFSGAADPARRASGCGRRGGAVSAGRRGSGKREAPRSLPCSGFLTPCGPPACGGSRSLPAVATTGPGEERDLEAEEGGRVGSQPRCGRGRAAFVEGSRRFRNFPSNVWRWAERLPVEYLSIASFC